MKLIAMSLPVIFALVAGLPRVEQFSDLARDPFGCCQE